MGYRDSGRFPGYYSKNDDARPLIGNSEQIKELYNELDKIIHYDSSVLITGERGTGKELAARIIHAESGRSKKRFEIRNCAAIPSQLFESEIFGHIRGAFTDAKRNRRGLFEIAQGGTAALDEIGEMPRELQYKLLTSLGNGEYTRVGDEEIKKIDTRLMAFTTRDLQAFSYQGVFLPELLDRISIEHLVMPQLRNRNGDIGLLSDYFITRLNDRYGQKREINHEVLDEFESYHWPGNVRELENAIERLYIKSHGEEEITTDHVKRYSDKILEKKDEPVDFLEKYLYRSPLVEKRFSAPEFSRITGLSQRSSNRMSQAINREVYGITDPEKYRKPRFREYFDYCDERNHKKITTLLHVAQESIHN